MSTAESVAHSSRFVNVLKHGAAVAVLSGMLLTPPAQFLLEYALSRDPDPELVDRLQLTVPAILTHTNWLLVLLHGAALGIPMIPFGVITVACGVEPRKVFAWTTCGGLAFAIMRAFVKAGSDPVALFESPYDGIFLGYMLASMILIVATVWSRGYDAAQPPRPEAAEPGQPE